MTNHERHTAIRHVDQRARGRGHFLQPGWKNPGGFRLRLLQIGHYFEGKSVLDVGCTSGVGREDWMHAGIAALASSAVGIDLDPVGIDKARALGFDVREGDAEQLSVDEKFQVIHAGELIEHLDNPRAFLASCRQHLSADGMLIVTTPNPFAIANFIYRLGGRPKVNGDHVCWYCEDTLRQLLERNGFDVMEMSYLRHETPGRIRAPVTRRVRALLPDRLAWNSVVVVARSVESRSK